MKFLLAICLLLTGCQKLLSIHGFEEYVDRFEKASRIHGFPVTVDNLIIKFESVENWCHGDSGKCIGKEGTCRRRFLQVPIIFINEKRWAIRPDQFREQLIFHELGHCVLFQPHRRDDKLSIMNPGIMPSMVYRNRRDEMLKELFQHTIDVHKKWMSRKTN